MRLIQAEHLGYLYTFYLKLPNDKQWVCAGLGEGIALGTSKT